VLQLLEVDLSQADAGLVDPQSAWLTTRGKLLTARGGFRIDVSRQAFITSPGLSNARRRHAAALRRSAERKALGACSMPSRRCSRSSAWKSASPKYRRIAEGGLVVLATQEWSVSVNACRRSSLTSCNASRGHRPWHNATSSCARCWNAVGYIHLRMEHIWQGDFAGVLCPWVAMSILRQQTGRQSNMQWEDRVVHLRRLPADNCGPVQHGSAQPGRSLVHCQKQLEAGGAGLPLPLNMVHQLWQPV
jgi:hypothetical protein